MKNKFLMLIILSTLVGCTSKPAGMVKHEYISSVSGRPGCTMPADPNSPKDYECRIQKHSFEVGTELIKYGDVCEEKTSELVELRTVQSSGHEIQLPQIQTTTKTTRCPGEETVPER